MITDGAKLLPVALKKFHFGIPWSSGDVFALTAVKTTEQSLPRNSPATVEVQRETYDLETRNKSNRLHGLRPVSGKWVGAVEFTMTKSCTSRASAKLLPQQFVYLLPHIP